MKPGQYDVVVANHGTIWGLTLRSKAAVEWVKENVHGDDFNAPPKVGGVQHGDWRPMREIVNGMILDGLRVGPPGIYNYPGIEGGAR